MWFLVSQLHAYVCEGAKVILCVTFITWPFIDFLFFNSALTFIPSANIFWKFV